ncbi:MAG: prenyltransferase/squalene oxidase repeat-containing protein [Planctomycetota bacterium]|jgi:hypothetical protein
MKHISSIKPFSIILDRVLPDGGFAAYPNGEYRPDATAWAALVLEAFSQDHNRVEAARTRLVNSQLSDGRISLSASHPESVWPTAMAILAWHGWRTQQTSQARAIQFLLRTSGKHWPNKNISVLGHDTSIPGWSWIENTHSWTEPTALGLMALKVTGNAGHERASHAIQMLLDRQLPKGGWNYGNTTVFGRELRPFQESTGMALSALSGNVPRKEVINSLKYLVSQVTQVRTPIALGWALLGLGSWQLYPEQGNSWIMESLSKQDRYGRYDTSSLCLLLTALMGNNGFINLFEEKRAEKL